jgi:hypothetical protein
VVRSSMAPLADNRVPLLAAPPSRTAAPVSLGWQFLRRQAHLLWLLRAYSVVLLLLVSLLEAGITSQVGAVASQFYQVFLDGNAAGLPRVLAWSTCLYLASAAVFTCRDVFKNVFAWQWRSRLTHHLQHLYHQQAAYYIGLKGLDTPDQRIAADTAQLTATMAEVSAGLAAVPFSVVWYTYLTRQVRGWDTCTWQQAMCCCSDCWLQHGREEGSCRKGVCAVYPASGDCSAVHPAMNDPTTLPRPAAAHTRPQACCPLTIQIRNISEPSS